MVNKFSVHIIRTYFSRAPVLNLDVYDCISTHVVIFVTELDHVTRKPIHSVYLLYALNVRMNLAMMHDKRPMIMMNDKVRII